MAKTKQTKVKHYTKRDCMAFAYLAPWIIGMLVLQLYPFLSSLAYSFCNYKITGTPQFAGLANYVQLFTLDNRVLELPQGHAGLHAVYRTRQAGHGTGCCGFSEPQHQGHQPDPHPVLHPVPFGGSVAVALLWKIMFMDTGVINSILTTLHLPSVQWLGDPGQALRTICMMEIWQFGSSMSCSLRR